MAVNSWSYSALAQYEGCPAQYRYARIDKLPTGPKPYFEKGIRIHTNLERFVATSGAAPLSDEVKREKDFIAELAAHPAPRSVEQKWGFAQDWSITTWSRAHFRLVNDVLIAYDPSTVEIVDWKSGKRYGSNADQMNLCATATFHRLPAVETVTTRLVYVESGGQEIADWRRADLAEMTRAWEARAERLFLERDWAPRPGDKCRFCDFSRSNQGPCRYG